MLTVTSLILRSAGVFFSARLSQIAGNAVMGLYSQIMNVYAFAITASAAGVNLGAVRIISECCGCDRQDKIPTAMRACISYCIKAGLLTFSVLFILAPLLGSRFICDVRSVSSLRALAFALPFISVSNAFHGYFNGVKKVSRSAFTSLFEQFVRIFSTIFALSTFSDASSEVLCLILVVCNAASEVISCFILGVFYLIDSRGYARSSMGIRSLRRRFLSITVPIAASSLIRSALTTAEHLLIPICLRKNGLGNDGALAEYGVVSGMVLPILLYPMALLSSFASITVAELSARVSGGESKERIRATVTKGLTFAIIYGIACCAIISCFSNELGYHIYKSYEAAKLLRVLAPLVFFMYLDHISDGMLKGLDKQNYVMKINIIDATLSVVFAAILIPKFGIYGFIASLYLCECLNCIFSFGRLFIMIRPKIKIFSTFVLPLCCAIISTHAANAFESSSLPFVPVLITCALIYIALLYFTGALKVFSPVYPAYAE
jgi:stage V sporulation protein B